MIKRNVLRLCGIAGLTMVLATVAPPGVYAGSLVANGTFTLPSGGGPLTAQQVVGTTPLANWFTPSNPNNSFTFLFLNSAATGSGTLNGGVSLYGPASQYALADSSNFVGMDGSYQVGPLSQTMTGLVSGDQYAVSFEWAGAQQVPFSGGVSCGTANPTANNCTTDQWDVFLGGVPTITNNQPAIYTTGQELSTPVVTTPNHGFTGWMEQTLIFTADATSETLSFVAQGLPGGAPPFALLGDVSMTKVPEPATVAILLTGIAGLGVGRLRRRR